MRSLLSPVGSRRLFRGRKRSGRISFFPPPVRVFKVFVARREEKSVEKYLGRGKNYLSY